MNLEESNSYNEEIESRDRKRRAVMLSIILCGVCIALLFIMIIVISYKDSITEKFFIDGKQVKFSNSLYKDINGVTYINVRTLSKSLGYSYTKGEYQQYNENEDSCYLQNDFEIVSLSAGDESYNKYIEISKNKPTIAEIPVVSKNDSGYVENYRLENPVAFEEDTIYVPLDSISKMFNIKVSWQEYRKKIFTLENRIIAAQTAIGKKYTEMSGYYENLRAIIDGYVVVSKSESDPKYYGVYSLNDNMETISLKYDDMTYIQNVGEFYITVENGTMGLLSADGGTIIAPSEFEKISLLDDDGENQLYLVKKGEEYGVVSRKGEILIHAENDEIGLDEKSVSIYTLDDIRNPSVLFDACIPVKKDGKYGLFNKKGDQILNLSYEGFGYESEAKSKTAGNEQSVLLIPASVGIKGIVVNYNDLYGIFDVTTEKLLLPCVYSKIYAITRNGKTTYYIEYNGASVNLQDYLKDKDNGLNNVDENGNELKAKKTNNQTDIQTNGEVISSNNIENSENNNSENQENGGFSEEPNVIELN